MMRLLDLRGQKHSRSELLRIIPRHSSDIDAARRAATQLVDDVRSRGVVAIREHAAQFDGVSEYDIRVPPEHFLEARASLDPAVLTALELTMRTGAHCLCSSGSRSCADAFSFGSAH